MMVRLLFVALAVGLMTTAAHATEIKGRARVIDGDTLWLGDIKVSLNGIDAPERGQARYRAATRALQGLVAGKTVVCRLNGEKSYDRYIGTCYVGEYDLAASVTASQISP